MRKHSAATIAGAVVLGVIVIAVAFFLLFDFKGLAERRASAALGRPVTIGALHPKIFPLGVEMSDLNVADIPENKPAFMKAAHINAVIGFWALFAGDVVFKHLNVEDAVARIERRPDGSLSWEVERPGEPPQKGDVKKNANQKTGANPKLPEIRDLRLHNVKMLYRDAVAKTNLTINLETRENEGKEPSLIVKGEGTFQNKPTTMAMVGGSILALRDTTTPYPVDGNLTSGDTSISVKGAVTDPVHITGLNIMLTVKGQDAADLYRIAGIALPATPPYTIETHLDRDGAKWIFKKLKWAMGKSDLAGELTWDMTEKVPSLTGTLHAQVVALDDLGGFIGAAPGEAKTPVAEKQQAATLERQRREEMSHPEKDVANELVIPDKTIDLEKLNSMNAKVHFEADKIIEKHIPFDRLKADIGLQNGVLTLTPLEFGAEQGRITLNLSLDSRAKPMVTKVEAAVQGFPLSRIVGKVGGENTNWGSIGGHFELRGLGDSMHRILATSDGNVGFAVGGGQISLFLVELAGLDIAESLGLLLEKDKSTQIRCVVGDFALEQGKMTARTMVADTKDTIFRGEGSIDLGREVMDMRLRAKPKDVSPATLRSKLLLKGTFANPSFGPDPKNIILKGGAAAVLGVFLTPVASILALIDPGGGKDANCEALYQDAAK